MSDKPVTITGPTQINNNSPGSVQNNFLGHPARTLENPATKQTLLDQLPRGAEFRIVRVNSQEAKQFGEIITNFLRGEGRVFLTDVVSLTGWWTGQSVERESNGVYVVGIGADNGTRGP